MDGEHVQPALQRFPEVLALDVDCQLKANVDTLQTQWFVRGLALKKLLRSQPQVRRFPFPLQLMDLGQVTRHVLTYASDQTSARRFLAIMWTVAGTARAIAIDVGFASETLQGCAANHPCRGFQANECCPEPSRSSEIDVLSWSRI